MRRTHSDTKGGTSIAVYSAKGGVGTTSVAVNLAFALAKTHPSARVALADLVASGGDVRVMLDLKPAYDMGELVRKVERIDAELLQSVLTPTAGGVWALPSAEDPEVAESLDAATATSIIEHLRSHFTFTVIDCEHHLSERTLAALDAADRVVLVTQLNVPALRSTQRTLALCQRLGYASDKLHVVVNRHHSGDLVSIADASHVLGCEIFFRIPNDYRTSAAALTRGVPVAEQDAASGLARSYVALASRLDGGTDSPLRDQSNGSRSNGGRNGSRLGRLFSLGRK
jgi:pilus assembly protein CpaE